MKLHWIVLALLLVSSVHGLELIKSVEEIPPQQAYRVILNYPIDTNEIPPVFMYEDGDTTQGIITDQDMLPDGTMQLRIQYQPADQLLFY
mgnify:FL=1